MASTPTFTILLIAFVQGVLLMSPPIEIDDPFPSPPLPPSCGLNEQYSVCGNLCEDTCSNWCEAPALQYFYTLNPSNNPACQAGCYCEPGYIRNRVGACVPNTPTVCGPTNDRCGRISPNAVYQKCMAGVSSACFRRTIAIRPAGFNGRCVCQQGYSMNLKKKCLKSDSRACLAEEDKPSRILFMQTTYDC